MLDDPGHLRQWLARRAQQALTLERWGEGLRLGLARLGPPFGPTLHRGAREARRRRQRLEALLGDLDVPPYGSLGLAGRLGRLAGSLLARLSSRGGRAAADRLVEHTLAEYTGLVALAEDFARTPPSGVEAARELLESARREARAWERSRSGSRIDPDR